MINILNNFQFRLIQSVIKKSKLLITSIVLSVLASSISMVCAPLTIGIAISGLHVRSEMFSLSMLFLYALCTVLFRLFHDIELYLMNIFENKVRLTANKEIAKLLFTMNNRVFIENNPSVLTSMVNDFFNSTKSYIQFFIMVMLSGFCDIAMTFFTIGIYTSWYISLFVLCYGALIYWLTRISNNRGKSNLDTVMETKNQAANLFGNAITTMTTLRLFHAENWILRLLTNYYDISYKKWMRYTATKSFYSFLQILLLFFQYVGVFILFKYLGINNHASQIAMATLALVQLNRPFELIARTVGDFMVAKAQAQPLLAILATSHTQLSSHDPTDNISAFNSNENKACPQFSNHIKITNLCYCYDSHSQPTLTNINAEFSSGQMNFIMGTSGAGKTTLINILAKFLEPYSGSIKFGDVELSSLENNVLLRHIGYVTQEPLLMNMSIRENLLLGRNYTDDQLLAVLKTTSLIEKIREIPQGLDYVIGESGQLLSGGEKQRLSIARAILAEPMILLLDEPSSALDAVTEQSIIEYLRALSKKITIIAITHRKHLTQVGDNILVLSPVNSNSYPK